MSSEDLLTEETTPIWFNVRKPVEFDESTSRIRLLQNAPVTQNSISALNNAQEIRFEYVPATDQVILLSDPNTCFRLRCTFYTYNTTNGTYQGATPPTTNLNPHADITLESAFFGYLFDRIELDVGSGTMPMDITTYFPYWFQLMCHLQPVDYKISTGDAMGYIPDENSGQAIGSTNPYITLINIGGAALAAGASGSFGIFAVVTPTAAVAANGAFPWTIPGTNVTIQLSAPAAMVANTTYTGIFQIAAIAAFGAAGTSTYNYPGLSLPVTATAATAIGAGLNITLINSTGATLTNETVGLNKYFASTSDLQLPLSIPYINQRYEPGYYKRYINYNTIPVGADGGRQFEIIIPLSYIFGFCNWFNRLTSNLSFTIRMLRSLTSNPFIGMPGTDGYLLINEMFLQICQVVPEDSYKLAYNTAIQRPVPVAFMSAISQVDLITSQNINVHFRTATYKPDFIFVMFKDNVASTTNNSQSNSTLNSNADIKDLQVSLNGEFYPVLTQDAHWGTDYRSVGINRFYEQFKQCCLKFSGECSMTYKQFRDLYPIFAFDLTAQTNKVRNTNVVFDIIGTRNSMTPTSVNMYTFVIYEKYFEASYLNNQINLKSSSPHMDDIQQQMRQLQTQLASMSSGSGFVMP